MKIFQVHNYYRTRGGECNVVDSERALLEKYGHEVMTYYCNSSGIGDLGMLDKVRMILSVPYNKSVERDIVTAIHLERPDVAHVHNVFPMLTAAVYKALNSCGVPVVQTVHNFRFLCPNGQFYVHNQICEDCQEKGFYSAVKNRCMQNSFLVSGAYAAALAHAWKSGILPNYINIYIALNQFYAKRLITAGVQSSRIRVLGNFVLESELTVSPKHDYVLYLGRLSQEKGIHTLLDAWKNIEGATLKIAGTGPMDNEIKCMIGHFPHKRIHLLGYVSGEAKQQLIKKAKCVVVPSEWYENFPVSIIEAMSLGTPVVVSNIGGLPEMVEHNTTGLVFETGNIAALEAALHSIITNQEKATRLSVNALKAAHDLYGPKKHYENLIDIYREAIYQ